MGNLDTLDAVQQGLLLEWILGIFVLLDLG